MDPIALLTFLRFPQPYDQLLQPQNLQLGHAGLSQNVKPPDPPTMGELGSVSELRSPNDWQFTAILLKQGLDIRICRNMDEFYRLIPSHSHRKWDQLESTSVQWLISGSWNGGTVPYKAIFSGDIPLHRPYIGLIYGRYLQFRFLKWPLIHLCVLLGFRSHVSWSSTSWRTTCDRWRCNRTGRQRRRRPIWDQGGSTPLIRMSLGA